MVSQSAFAARLREGRPARALLLELSRLSGWIAFPAMFGMIVLSEPIVALVFGEKWSPAAPALSIVGLIGAYLAVEVVHQSYCLAARKMGAFALVVWLEVALAAGAVVLTASQGLTGVSYGFAASFLVLWCARFAIVSNLSGAGVVGLVRQHLTSQFRFSPASSWLAVSHVSDPPCFRLVCHVPDRIGQFCGCPGLCVGVAIIYAGQAGAREAISISIMTKSDAHRSSPGWSIRLADLARNLSVSE